MKDISDAVRLVVSDHLDADIDLMAISEVLENAGIEHGGDFLEDVYEAVGEELRSVKRYYEGDN